MPSWQCRGTLLVLLAVASTAAGPLGFTREHRPPTHEAVEGHSSPATQFSAEVDLVTLNVAVLDDDGSPVTGLRSEDFVVRDEGVERPVTVVLAPDEARLDLALVLDLSRSMERIAWRRLTRDFAAALDPEDCVLLFGFSSGVGGWLWAPPGDETLERVLEATRPGGRTALWDGLLDAISRFDRTAPSGPGSAPGDRPPSPSGDGEPDRRSQSAPTIRGTYRGHCPAPVDPADPSTFRRRALVLLSDGNDNDSEATRSDVLRAARRSRLPMFPVELPPPASRGPFDREAITGLSPLKPLASETGGRMVLPGQLGQEKVLRWLRGSYLIGYAPPARSSGDTDGETEEHEVEVRLVRDGARVYHPPRYTIERRRAPGAASGATGLSYISSVSAGPALFQIS